MNKKKPTARFPALLLSIALGLTVDLVFAQEEERSGSAPSLSYSLSASAYHQPAVDLEGGGEFSLNSALLRFGVKRRVSPATVIGLSLKYDADDYDFSGVTEFGGLDPWNDVRRFGISLPIFTRLRNDWSLGFSPSVNWLQEYGADTGESLAIGASAFAIKNFSRHKSIGLGAGVFRSVEDDIDAFPFIAVDWRFNERWRISNPFEADVLGPAGLQLSYTLNDQWYIAGGGVYRSFRFRLDDRGIAPNGIGENEGIVSFLRLSRQSPGGIQFDIYAGATLNGKLELKNSDGSDLANSEYDPAPFVAVTLGGEF